MGQKLASIPQDSFTSRHGEIGLSQPNSANQQFAEKVRKHGKDKIKRRILEVLNSVHSGSTEGRVQSWSKPEVSAFLVTESGKLFC